jgi:hypothetical protein
MEIGKAIAAEVFQGKVGHPAGFSETVLEPFLSENGAIPEAATAFWYR